jgi:hypothetical protein
MEFRHSSLVVGSAWVSWQDDLHDLGLDRLEVLKRLQDTHTLISKYVHAKAEESQSKLRRACKQAEAKVKNLAALFTPQRG